MSDVAPRVIYLRRPDFLTADAVDALLRCAERSERTAQPTGVGNGETARIDPAKRLSARLTLSPDLKAAMRARLMEALPQVAADLGTSLFAPSKIEVELIAHGDGAFYTRHIDTKTQSDVASLRIVSGVYYFHRAPKAFSGGALRLYEAMPSDTPRFVDIVPEHNVCVFFPSWMPHEVLPVRVPSGAFLDSRFAINCWYRRATAG